MASISQRKTGKTTKQKVQEALDAANTQKKTSNRPSPGNDALNRTDQQVQNTQQAVTAPKSEAEQRIARRESRVTQEAGSDLKDELDKTAAEKTARANQELLEKTGSDRFAGEEPKQKTQTEILQSQLDEERQKRVEAEQGTKSVAKQAAEGLTSIQNETKDFLQSFRDEFGDKFSEIEQSLTSQGVDVTDPTQLSPDYERRAKAIMQIEDEEIRKRALDRLAAEQTTTSQQVASPQIEQQAVQQPQPAQETITSPQPVSVTQNALQEQQNTQQRQVEQEAVPPAIQNPFDFSISSVIGDFEKMDNNSYDIITKALAKQIETAPETFIGLGKSQRELDSYLKQLNNTQNRLNEKRKDVKERTAREIDFYENIFNQQKAGLEDREKLIKKRSKDLQQELKDQKGRDIATIDSRRKIAEVNAKAQVAIGAMPGGTHYVNRMATISAKFTELEIDANVAYSAQLSRLSFEQNSTLLDFADRYTSIDMQAQQTAFSAIQEMETALDAIDDNDILLENEREGKRQEKQEQFRTDFANVIAQGNATLAEEAAAAEAKINSIQKAKFDHLGFVYGEAPNGEVFAITGDDGKPLKTWEQMTRESAPLNAMKKAQYSAMGIAFSETPDGDIIPAVDDQGNLLFSSDERQRQFSNNLQSSRFNMDVQNFNISQAERQAAIYDFDLPQAKETLDAWALQQRSGALAKYENGLMTRTQYQNYVDQINEVKKFQENEWQEASIFMEGSRTGQTNPMTAQKIEQIFDGGEQQYSKLANNCVYFTRECLPNLPRGLFTLADKLGITNSDQPEANSAAIMDVGDSTGHIGFVEKVVQGAKGALITIAEGNFPQGKFNRRTGTEEELGIVGYFQDPNYQQVQQQAQSPQLAPDVEALVQGRINGNISETDFRNAISEYPQGQQRYLFGEISRRSKTEPREQLDFKLSAVAQSVGGTADERAVIEEGLRAEIDSGRATTPQEAKINLGFVTDQDKEVKKRISGEITPQLKDYREILRNTANINELAKLEGGIGDTAAITAFLKTIDPGSVARESEVAGVENARGIIDSAAIILEKAKSGDRLSPNQRVQLQQTAKVLGGLAQEKMLETLITRKQELLERGVEPTVVSQPEIDKLIREIGEERAATVFEDAGVPLPPGLGGLSESENNFFDNRLKQLQQMQNQRQQSVSSIDEEIARIDALLNQ